VNAERVVASHFDTILGELIMLHCVGRTIHAG
jgi:hypothetical protein